MNQAERLARLVAGAKDKPHGTRARYSAGRCRCDACRRANTVYENERQKARRRGDWNGLVDAGPARAYIAKLRRQGVGRNIIADCSRIGRTLVVEIMRGIRPRIRARTLRRILAVTTAMRGDNAVIGSAPTWRLVDELLEEGYTIGRIALEFGYARPYLQIRRDRPITVRNAARMRRVHERLTA